MRAVESDSDFFFSPRPSFSVGVTVLVTSVPWGFTDGYLLYTCRTVATAHLYVDLAATPESFITLSLSLPSWCKKELKRGRKKKEMLLFFQVAFLYSV